MIASLRASAGSPEPAPLLGHNLVRLVYLDEGGVDEKAPVLAVAGVLVHGDREYFEIDRRIRELIEKYIPPADRLGFIFHATDIFHGSGYFDRRKPEWDLQEKRIPIISDLARIIEDMHLPCVLGSYQKDSFWKGVYPELLPKIKGKIIHNAAIVDCLIRADAWLAMYAPSEVATVVHEDGVPMKKQIKSVVRTLRTEELLNAEGFQIETRKQFGLPLKRIIDTVHFAEKADARPLQLADLCAFVWARGLKNMPIPAYAYEVIWKQIQWMINDLLPLVKCGLSPSWEWHQ